MMKEAHYKAAEKLFESRNKQFKNSNVLDLHGLHVKEALIYAGEREKGKDGPLL